MIQIAPNPNECLGHKRRESQQTPWKERPAKEKRSRIKQPICAVENSTGPGLENPPRGHMFSVTIKGAPSEKSPPTSACVILRTRGNRRQEVGGVNRILLAYVDPRSVMRYASGTVTKTQAKSRFRISYGIGLYHVD